MAEKKVWTQQSYQVAIRRQSFSLLNVFSIKCCCLYHVLSKENASFPVFRGGMQTVIPLAFSDSRNHVASYPPSDRNVLLSGRRCWRMAAPLSSLTCPSVSKSRTGRPCPSQTIWSLEFRPPFVRPIRRGESPF